MKIYFFFLVLFLCPIITNQAQAQNVSSPSLSAPGEWEFNNAAFYAVNDGDDADVFEQKTRVEYGVYDWLALTYAAEFEQIEDNSIEFENSEVRAIIRLTGEGAPVNAAMRLVYDHDHIGDSNSVGAELLLGQRFGQWRHLLNIDTAHDVGEKSEDGVELDFAWGSYYSFENFRLGAEYYWDLGNLQDHQTYSDQAHQIGGSIKFNAGHIAKALEPIDLEFAYFTGISRGADDHVFKNEIEFEF